MGFGGSAKTKVFAFKHGKDFGTQKTQGYLADLLL
jgi:hypothetical protein